MSKPTAEQISKSFSTAATPTAVIPAMPMLTAVLVSPMSYCLRNTCSQTPYSMRRGSHGVTLIATATSMLSTFYSYSEPFLGYNNHAKVFPMKTTSWVLTKCLSLASAIALLCACAGNQPLPNYAKTGDTISVALAGAKADTFIDKRELSASITDAGGLHPVKVRHLLRLYADPVSDHGMSKTDGSISALPGQWVAVIDLIDPVTEIPPALVGGGQAATLLFTYTGADAINFTGQQLIILDSVGQAHPLTFFGGTSSLVSSLEPRPHLFVGIDSEPAESLAAAHYRFSCEISEPACPSSLSVARISQHPNVQLIQRGYDDAENGVRVLEIYLLNPQGFIDATTGSTDDIPFAITWPLGDGVSSANWASVISVEASFFDIDGAMTDSVSPSIKPWNI